MGKSDHIEDDKIIETVASDPPAFDVTKKTRDVRQDQPVFSVRVEENVKKAFERWTKRQGITKRQAAEYAMKLAMHNQPIPAPGK